MSSLESAGRQVAAQTPEKLHFSAWNDCVLDQIDTTKEGIRNACVVASARAGSRSKRSEREMVPMIWSCANPDCSTKFNCKQGRLYLFPKRYAETDRPINTHSVQHFWLCRACCETCSLKYHPDSGVTIHRTSAPGARRFIAAA